MEEKNMDLWENYRKRTHVIGRITSTIVLLMLLAAPFLIGKYLGAFPDLKAVAGGFFVVDTFCFWGIK